MAYLPPESNRPEICKMKFSPPNKAILKTTKIYWIPITMHQVISLILEVLRHIKLYSIMMIMMNLIMMIMSTTGFSNTLFE